MASVQGVETLQGVWNLTASEVGSRVLAEFLFVVNRELHSHRSLPPATWMGKTNVGNKSEVTVEIWAHLSPDFRYKSHCEA